LKNLSLKRGNGIGFSVRLTFIIKINVKIKKDQKNRRVPRS
jgi:hypothetical protein